MGFNTNIPTSEIDFRISKILSLLANTGIDAIILNNNANLFYTAGYIFNGYVLSLKLEMPSILLDALWG